MFSLTNGNKMNQSFTVNQLIKLCKKGEIEKTGLNKEVFKENLKKELDKLYDNTLDFEIIKHSKFLNVDSIYQKLLLTIVRAKLKL